MKRSSSSSSLLILLICLLGLAHIWWLSFVCDDAFISFRYAKNLVDGHGLVFNLGERVEGYTNFLWVMVCALIIDAGARPEVWTLWISGACALAILAIVMVYLQRRSKDYLFAGVLLAANGGFAAWATGGLETALFTCLVTLGCLAILAVFRSNEVETGQESGRSPNRVMMLSAASLALAAMTRPEGVLVTGLCGAFLLIQVVRQRFGWRTLLLWIAVWIIPYGIYFIWRYQYYGQIFPNTFYVKSSGLAMVPVGFQYLFSAAQRFHAYLLVIPAVFLLIVRRGLGISKETLLFSGVLVVPYLGYVALVGGDFMDMFRFVVPVIPIAMLVIGQTWRAFFEYVASTRSRTTALATVSVLLSATVGLNLYTSWESQKNWYRDGLDSIGKLRDYHHKWTLAAEYFRSVGQPTDTLAITAAGIIPYYTGMYTIDQLGLIAANLSGYYERDANRPGHNLLASGEYLFGMRPHFIIGHPKVDSTTVGLRATLYIEESWFTALERYQKIVAQLSKDHSLYMAYALRNDRAATQSP